MRKTQLIRLGFLPTVLLMMSPFKPLLAQTANSAPIHTIRDAFLLGFSYGNAHNLYSRNTDFTGDVRSQYDSFMKEAVEYGKRIGLSVDSAPPPVDSANTSRQAGIIRQGRHQADLIAIALSVKQGDAPAAGLTLGYMAALAVEYVPLLDLKAQQNVTGEYRTLAAKMGLSETVVNQYARSLMTSTDRKVTVKAMLDFENAVLGYFEGLDLRTSSGARRQLNVWSMGWTVGLATLGQVNGADPAVIERMFAESRTRAGLLEVQLPMLPAGVTKSARDSASALHYLLDTVGKEVGDALKYRQGPRAAALLELAIKSTIATILYGPDDDDLTRSLIAGIDRAGAASGLPVLVYEPLVRKMTARQPYQEVKQEIQNLNLRVTQYFTDK